MPSSSLPPPASSAGSTPTARLPESVLIVGAGDVGLGVAASLAAGGVAVTTLNRSGRSVPDTATYIGDLADVHSLRGLADVAPADGWSLVIFTTAPPGREAADYRLAYIEGPARLLDALPLSPARAVLISTTGVIGVDDGSWVDESTDAPPRRATAEIVLEGESALHDRITTCVVRPAGIYGPGRNRLRDAVKNGTEPVAADGTCRWTNRIHRDDLVAAIVCITGNDQPPRTVLAVDHEPSPKDDVIRFLADQLGAPEPPTTTVPRTTGKRGRNDLLRSLGWSPRFATFREGYRAG